MVEMGFLAVFWLVPDEELVVEALSGLDLRRTSLRSPWGRDSLRVPPLLGRASSRALSRPRRSARVASPLPLSLSCASWREAP